MQSGLQKVMKFGAGGREAVVDGLITEQEEMQERLAFATAKWFAAQAEVARLRKIEEAARLHVEHGT
ncbi:MAG: hypothetical protein WB297_11800, partial [Actinomycetota bacterium]